MEDGVSLGVIFHGWGSVFTVGLCLPVHRVGCVIWVIMYMQYVGALYRDTQWYPIIHIYNLHDVIWVIMYMQYVGALYIWIMGYHIWIMGYHWVSRFINGVVFLWLVSVSLRIFYKCYWASCMLHHMCYHVYEVWWGVMCVECSVFLGVIFHVCGGFLAVALYLPVYHSWCIIRHHACCITCAIICMKYGGALCVLMGESVCQVQPPPHIWHPMIHHDPLSPINTLRLSHYHFHTTPDTHSLPLTHYVSPIITFTPHLTHTLSH